MERVSPWRRSAARWTAIVVALVLAVRSKFLPAWMLSLVIVVVFVAAVLAVRTLGRRLTDERMPAWEEPAVPSIAPPSAPDR